VVNYFAVNTVLSHWDGFFNNYFAYNDRAGTGKRTKYFLGPGPDFGRREYVTPEVTRLIFTRETA